MFKFTSLPTVRFGKPATVVQVGPQAHLTRATLRRAKQLKAAADVLVDLPADGEALHCLQSALFDLTSVLVLLVDRLGTCSHMRIATLAFSKRNLTQLLELFDIGQVKRLSLLGSTFHRNHFPGEWAEAEQALQSRGQHAAVYTNHSKVITLDFQAGPKLTIEGSANLRSNRSLESFVITHDAGLHDWTATWIDLLIAQNEGEPTHATAST
jgi:hypothetical protein